MTDIRAAIKEARKPSASMGAISLEEGYLTPEQISLILQHIPLDIAFVNEFDKVKNVNHGGQTTAIHEETAATFKAGTQAAMESWDVVDTRFVHQQLIAFHDTDGNYKGVLEVKQDVTDIRALEGGQCK